MRQITIPQQLRDAVDEDDFADRCLWLAGLPAVIDELATSWALTLGDPYLPGGQCAWVAPATDTGGAELVLKVGWRHREAEHEADGLRHWNGAGAIRCLAERKLEDTTALLLERCAPGTQLSRTLPEPEQDPIIAGLLRRLHDQRPPSGHPFGSLDQMCAQWADCFEFGVDAETNGLDRGLAAEALAIFRTLPGSARDHVLLCTDLHAGNVLAAQREPWLAIDPKPFVGDPAYDAVQHMLNCDERLATQPIALADRMAALLELDPERVRLWLFARCTQEALCDLTMREPARALAP